MPIYAYIKIPGIQNSESTDEKYGKEWIPIRSFKFKTEASVEDETTNRQSGEDDAPSETGAGVPRQTSDSKKRFNHIKNRLERWARGERSPAMRESAAEADGEITVDKWLDATSPKLHNLCQECSKFATDQYIKGMVEVHICRQIQSEEGDKASREAYLGYVLENCRISSLSVTASTSSNMVETFTIKFEMVTSCIRQPKQNLWQNLKWNFLSEDTDSASKLSTP
ncbi:type VI protein secretion system component Hcp [Ereboglobus sp. PH5-5]|uniref:type VI secretion system tube protein Hcp n=1 Tax=unclassified Ereboglobus TaxID=2626932 RepID=UPI0024056BCA|nr:MULTISPECIES: type VI secretion system tube protein Hcp [unclassified Ereboglobus]MDF9826552.1 type VI protein secretion system component Hcp [Ereboglobus sp. PH5-10]MDF9832742.1 type VI protein secretion system component Hcp [Ereboglobus sp. PH5-5]